MKKQIKTLEILAYKYINLAESGKKACRYLTLKIESATIILYIYAHVIIKCISAY